MAAPVPSRLANKPSQSAINLLLLLPLRLRLLLPLPNRHTQQPFNYQRKLKREQARTRPANEDESPDLYFSLYRLHQIHARW